MMNLFELFSDLFSSKGFQKLLNKMFSKEMILGLLIIVIVVVGIRVLYLQLKRRLKEKVRENSDLCKKLQEINNRYQFFEDLETEYTCSKELNTRKAYNRFKFDDFFEEVIEINLTLLEEVIFQVKENRKLLNKYNKEVERIKNAPMEEYIKAYDIPIWLYERIEKIVFEEEQLNPVINPIFICSASYETPQGRYFYEDEVEYSFDELLYHYENVMTKMRNKESKEFQRKMMTDSLRYNILKRDNFRCVLCGRSAQDGETILQVDHIIPVSKGGKTVESNLRTLCKTCNMGKRDKYDENGVN